MRNTIGLLLFLCFSLAFAQRVEFKDPDLSFSFKKPKNWQIIDDGYVVKAVPTPLDTASIFFSITYFEDAQPLGTIPLSDQKESSPDKIFKTKIAKESARYSVNTVNQSIQKTYQFYKYGQRFEVITRMPAPVKNPKYQNTFRRIIRSIRVSR